MKRWLIGLTLAVLACAAQAVPTVSQVESEVQKGNYAQAQSMMHEVVVAKPGSARAHYIYAEILAHNDQFAQAAQELGLAKQLDPGLKFTSPEKSAAFEQLLEREQQRQIRSTRPAPGLDNLGPTLRAPTAVSPMATPPVSAGLPGWVWPVGLVVLGVLAWNWLRRSRTPSPLAAGTGYGAGPGYAGGAPGYAGGAPMGAGPMGGVGGVGGGGAGWVGTGLAAAGGVAAGMLAEKLLEHGHEGSREAGFLPRDASYEAPPASDADARALEQRNVDFGNGGNDWSDGGSDGGSVDLGGGGGGDDGGW
jgi:hypothetical protein